MSDLQDPPELLVEMLEHWRAGAPVVWAVRRRGRARPGDAVHAGLAALYYWMMRRLVGLRDMPPGGVDFFLVDRVVIDAFRQVDGRHASVFVVLMSLGFRGTFVPFDKQPRLSGTSGWTLSRQVKLAVDSVVSVSAFPLWWCVGPGAVLILLGLVPAVAAMGATGAVRLLWLTASLLLWTCGVQLVAFGLAGRHVWRALERRRAHPASVIEAVAGRHETPAGVACAGRKRQETVE